MALRRAYGSRSGTVHGPGSSTEARDVRQTDTGMECRVGQGGPYLA